MNAQSKQQPYAIVIGLESIVGLQTARILAAHGVPIIAITDDPRMVMMVSSGRLRILRQR
jgi:hypothetical protein